ncbi:DNA-binding domain-containing protein [Maricaulis sp.]|uniref:DNA-binding domain-containing protein n=1 Tax=Maricaulis sp. TaxID=1486257 RepID=UPI002634360C|nr:DNA-binding domain-containing protein [Maricaulis sp.]
MSDAFFRNWSYALRSGDADALLPYLADERARQHFAVYRNNVVSAAIEALRSAYPVVNQLVGDSFFSPMAKLYWDEHPPQDRSMTLYGAGFAEHIASYGPAARLGYLPDIARLDRAWLDAHHAAERETLSGEAVSALPAESLPQLSPGLHPSVHVVELDWPVFDVWAAHRVGRSITPTEIAPGHEHIVIWRFQSQVKQSRLSPAHAAFLAAIGEGRSLQQAVERAAAEGGREDPAGFFGHALSHGLIAAPAPNTI